MSQVGGSAGGQLKGDSNDGDDNGDSGDRDNYGGDNGESQEVEETGKFLERFAAPDTDILKCIPFEGTVLKSGEKVENYLNEMQVQGARLELSEEDIQPAIIMGLPVEYKNFIWAHGPKELSTTLTKIVLWKPAC